MRIFCRLSQLLLFFSPLFARETIFTENDPSFLVEGVSVISGDFYTYAEDYVVTGAEPVHVPRSYNSLTGTSSLNLEYLSSIYMPPVQKLIVTEPNGTPLCYMPNTPVPNRFFKQGHMSFEAYSFARDAPGVANTASGQISAKTNLKNHYLCLDPHDAEQDAPRGFDLYAANGTTRRYTRIPGQKPTEEEIPNSGLFSNKIKKTWYSARYRLDIEQLPNGNRICYSWQGDQLREIRTTNPHGTKTYASLQIQHPRMQGSDGGFVSYVGEPSAIIVQTSGLPDQRLSFEMIDNNRRKLLRKLTLPRGREFQIEYENNSRRRVQNLSLPIGQNGSLVQTHRFSYQIDKKNSCVLDAYDNKTLYFWNEKSRPQQIERFDGASLYNMEQFVWDGTNLKCKWLFDNERNPVSAKLLQYDNEGNVLEETFFGNLSGLGNALQTGSDLQKSNAERSVRKNKYNARNLNTYQEDPNGLVTLTEYRNDCCLPTSQRLCEGSAVKVQKTFEYDTDLICVREILNDGAATLIRETEPRRENPFVGMPHSIVEKDGNGALLRRTVLHRNRSGLVNQVDVYDATNTFRYSLYNDYDEKGRLIRETNALGQEKVMHYDELGNCIYEKDFSNRFETHYHYDLGNRLIKKEEFGEGCPPRVTHYTYNHRHHLISEIDPYSNETQYICDPFGQRIETHLPPQISSDGVMRSPVIYQTYDCAGNVISHKNAEDNTTQKSYNAYNKPILVIHPDGSREAYVYNLDGSLKFHLDPEGITTSYTYDVLAHVISKCISSNQELLSEETFEYIGNHLMAKIDAEGNRTTYTYDAAGRKASEEFSGETTLYFCDALGRQNIIQKGELQSISEFDLLDQVIEQRAQSLSGEILRKERYEYDSAGNRAAVIQYVNGKESREEFVYDAFKRLIWRKNALGAIETTLYENTPHRTTHTDAMGLQTIETYDTQNRIASIEKRKAKTLSLEEKFYDLRGNLHIQVNTIYAPDNSSRKTQTRWEYDNRGRLSTLVEADGTLDAKETRYKYTPNGKKAQTIKSDSGVLFYGYNGLGYLTSLTSSDGTVNHQMTYNRLGHLLTTDGIQRVPDAKGRVLLETFPNGHSIQNRYDLQGRRVECRIPKANDLLIEYTYNALDLQRITCKKKDGRFTHLYGKRDLAGNLLQEQLINGSTITYSIDALSRRIGLETKLFKQEILEFDPVGNIHAMRVQGYNNSYKYDDLYQLTSETGLFTHSYAYDTLYNRLQKDDEDYQINALNQAVSHFVYDLNGNPIRRGNTRYTYDALDRLIRLEAPTLTQTFTYDSEHRCLQKSTLQKGETKTFYFLYDGKNEIGSFNEELEPMEIRVLGRAPQAEIGAAILITLEKGPYVPIHDLQGNIAVLTPVISQSGVPTTYLYSAFGEEKIFGPTISPWRFSSKRSDERTGLVYYGRRFYVPEQGRWLTPDPAGFADGMNLYAFVHNDPLTHLDLYGLLTTGIMAPAVREFALLSQMQNFRAGEGRFEDSYFRYPGTKGFSPFSSKPRGEVLFFSGIGTQFDGEKEFTGILKYISKLGGGIPVHGICMPTFGLKNDLMNCDATFRTGMNATILHIERLLREASERVGSNGRLLVLTSSAGAMNGVFGGKRLSEEVLEKIDFRGFAPATIAPRGLFGSVQSYMSSNHDFLMTYHKYCNKQEYRHALDTGLLQTVPAHPDASTINDHGILSPTFRKPIQDLLRPFVNSYDCR